jgi:hypothetical protein
MAEVIPTVSHLRRKAEVMDAEIEATTPAYLKGEGTRLHHTSTDVPLPAAIRKTERRLKESHAMARRCLHGVDVQWLRQSSGRAPAWISEGRSLKLRQHLLLK